MSGTIQVGAWDGSEFMRSRGSLIAFEPQADAFRRLSENLSHRENVTLVNIALGAKPGKAELHVSYPDHSSSILAPVKQLDIYPDITFDGSTETVKVSTLDAEMNGQNGFDYLILDVQGYELEVLKGATSTLHQVQRIKCEVNWDEVYEGCARLEQIDAFLETRGFRRTKLIKHPRGMCGDAYYRR